MMEKKPKSILTPMRTVDFDYHLPPEFIAQYPAPRRDRSRLLCLDRATGALDHRIFSDLPLLLGPGDHLVFNNTRVLPARLWCRKSTGARVELLCTERIDGERWKAAAKPRRRLREGMVLTVEKSAETEVAVESLPDDGSAIVFAPRFDALLEHCGEVPLPHYIRRDPETSDRERYQTVYAEKPGAVAAPTAGLHFTHELLSELKTRGVHFSNVTLNVGLGTFRPVKADDPRDHPIHQESYELSEVAVREINQTKSDGGRIIAVGTTVVRVLEHCALSGRLHQSFGTTRMLILPGFEFKVIDGLITNFHLPRSTLLMLVSAFAGRERILHAYHAAIEEKYRFFSYGDAMYIR